MKYKPQEDEISGYAAYKFDVNKTPEDIADIQEVCRQYAGKTLRFGIRGGRGLLVNADCIQGEVKEVLPYRANEANLVLCGSIEVNGVLQKTKCADFDIGCIVTIEYGGHKCVKGCGRDRGYMSDFCEKTDCYSKRVAA